MARNKTFMCMNECIPFIEIDGERHPKRYRFGETIDCPNIPNEHFIELLPEQQGKPPWKILQDTLDDLDIRYSHESPDTVLQRLYQEHKRHNAESNNLEALKVKAKKIGAKFHHLWKDPKKVQAAIEEREIELSTEG